MLKEEKTSRNEDSLNLARIDDSPLFQSGATTGPVPVIPL
jgi:hypothetical protein